MPIQLSQQPRHETICFIFIQFADYWIASVIIINVLRWNGRRGMDRIFRRRWRKHNVFSFLLKKSMDAEVVISFGRSFEIRGTAALKALAHVVVPMRATVRRLRSAVRSDLPWLYDDMNDARYASILVERTLKVTVAILKSTRNIGIQCSDISVVLSGFDDVYRWRRAPGCSAPSVASLC